MKRKMFVLLIATSLFSHHVMAQIPVPGVSKITRMLPKPELGLKLGANFQTLSGDAWQNTYKPGIVGGAFVGLVKGKIGVRVECLINSSHYTTSSLVDSVKHGELRATYFDVPVLFEYKAIPFVWLQIGPQFSSLMSIKNLDGFTQDSKKMFKSGEFAGIIGLEAKLPIIPIIFGVRYVLGLTDMNNTSAGSAIQKASGSWNNRSVQLSVGFKFL